MVFTLKCRISPSGSLRPLPPSKAVVEVDLLRELDVTVGSTLAAAINTLSMHTSSL